MDDYVKMNQRKYYEDQIGELLHRRTVLLLENDDHNVLLLGEKIKELIQKLEELR